MLALRWALLLLLALFAVAYAQPREFELFREPAGLYPVKLTLSPAPPNVGKAHFVLDVELAAEGDGKLPEKLTAELRLDMPEMCAMRPTVANLTRVAPGRFEGDSVFSMVGPWRIVLALGTPYGRYQLVKHVSVGGKQKAPQTSPAATPTPGVPFVTLRPDRALRVGDNRLVIRVEAPKVQRVMVGADMPGMAMPVLPREAYRQPNGSFIANVPLMMDGLWQITVDVDGHLTKHELAVQTAGRRPISLGLFVLTLVLLVPVGLWLSTRGRPTGGVVMCGTMLAWTFAAGAVIQRYWPPDSAMGMAMDMKAPDMGMGDLIAPFPVLEYRVQRTSMAVRRNYVGSVRASGETFVLAPQSGPVLELADSGFISKPGRVLGRVGSGSAVARTSGLVTRRLVEPGAMVSAGTPLLAVSDMKDAYVDFLVPTTELMYLVPGLPIEALESESSVRGTIVAVAGVSQGKNVRVSASVDNYRPPPPPMTPMPGAPPIKKRPVVEGRPGVLAVGQEVTVRCVVEQLNGVLTVPREAVRDEAVYVIENVAGQKLVHRRPVTMGASNDTHVVVTSGLQEGETIVGYAERGLRDGIAVVSATWGSGAYRDLLLPQITPSSHL